jgi:hypothetical protein
MNIKIPSEGYVGFPVLADGSIPTYHQFESRQHAFWWWVSQMKRSIAKVFANGVEQDPRSWRYKGRVRPFAGNFNPGENAHPIDYLAPKRGRVRRMTRGQKPH